MLAMQEFEGRGAKPGVRLTLHGYVEKVTDGGTCTRCDRRLEAAYLVSHGKPQATDRLCGKCHSEVRRQWGNRYENQAQEGE